MLKKLYRFLHPRYQTLFLEYPVDMRPRYGHGKPPHPELYELIAKNREDYRNFLQSILSDKKAFLALKHEPEGKVDNKPYWNNHFFPGLDVLVLFKMLGTSQAGKYLEVGSGNSTKVAAYAKEYFNLATEIVSVDPMPRAEIDSLSDHVIRKPFEETDLAIYLELQAGDILFIDNSHRLLPNSDATVFFMEVLPRLKKGVKVHIHDIYLPYDYPQFMCDRFYTEQYALALCLLSAPERYKVTMPNYFVSEDPELSAVLASLWQEPEMKGVEQHGGSFWLEIC